MIKKAFHLKGLLKVDKVTESDANLVKGLEYTSTWGALPPLYVFYKIMTFIMQIQCSLASTVKGFLPLFNLDLSHHKQVIQTSLCVGVIIFSQIYQDLKRLAEQFREKKLTACCIFLLKVSWILYTQPTCFELQRRVQSELTRFSQLNLRYIFSI